MWNNDKMRNNPFPGITHHKLYTCELCGSTERKADRSVHPNGFTCRNRQDIRRLSAAGWIRSGEAEQHLDYFAHVPHEIVNGGLWVPEWVDVVWRFFGVSTVHNFAQSALEFGRVVGFMNTNELVQDSLLALIRLGARWHEVVASAKDLDTEYTVFDQVAKEAS